MIVPVQGYADIEIPDGLQLIGVSVINNTYGGGFAIKKGANWDTSNVHMPYSGSNFVISTVPPSITVSNSTTWDMVCTIGYIE